MVDICSELLPWTTLTTSSLGIRSCWIRPWFRTSCVWHLRSSQFRSFPCVCVCTEDVCWWRTHFWGFLQQLDNFDSHQILTHHCQRDPNITPLKTQTTPLYIYDPLGSPWVSSALHMRSRMVYDPALCCPCLVPQLSLSSPWSVPCHFPTSKSRVTWPCLAGVDVLLDNWQSTVLVRPIPGKLSEWLLQNHWWRLRKISSSMSSSDSWYMMVSSSVWCTS